MPVNEIKIKEHIEDILTRRINCVSSDVSGTLSRQHINIVDNILSWTCRWYAPPLEKVIDALVAHTVVLKHVKSGRLIDMACGAGRFLDATFAEILHERGVVIDGVDLESEIESSLRVFNERAWSRHSIKGNFNKLGIRSGYYDYIFCNNSFMSGDNIEKTLLEMHRICKDGGLLIFNSVTPYFAEEINKIGGSLGDFGMSEYYSSISSRRYSFYFDFSGISETMKTLGWKVISTTDYLSGDYAYVYFNMYLPYVAFWKYETNSSALPDWYPSFRDSTTANLKKYIRDNIYPQFLEAFQNNIHGKGAKMYIVAEKIPGTM